MTSTSLSFTSIFSTPQRRIRRAALAVSAATLLLTVGLGAHAYLDLKALAEERVVDVSATVKAIPDLTALSQEADLVVVGRVVGDGTTRILEQTIQPHQRVGQTGTAAGTGSGATAKGLGTPLTSYTVEVERVVRGAVRPGSTLTLVQMGGKVSLPTIPGGPDLKRTVQYEHDTLLSPGERNLFFLHHSDANTYYVVGGAQGRLVVDRSDKLHTVGHGSPATRGRDGQSIDTLIADIR